MAKKVLRNAYLSVDSHDISDHVDQLTVETKYTEVDVTGMGANFMEILLGLGDATITAEVFSDYDSGSIDDIVWPLVGSNDPVTIAVRPENDTVSSDNPEYSMDAVVSTNNPVAGKVGDAAKTTLTFRNATQTGLVRSAT